MAKHPLAALDDSFSGHYQPMPLPHAQWRLRALRGAS
jgi:hypothetical protein